MRVSRRPVRAEIELIFLSETLSLCDCIHTQLTSLNSTRKVKMNFLLNVRIFTGYFLSMEESKKEGRYQRIITQLSSLLTKTSDPVARMATIAAVLSHKFDYFFWCGFYFAHGDTMIVGPYQGPVACQVLQGSGVCLASVAQQKSIVVGDVHQFPGHIACDSRSSSEIVVPVRDTEGHIVAVLDVDSTTLNSFSETDRIYLEIITALVYAAI